MKKEIGGSTPATSLEQLASWVTSIGASDIGDPALEQAKLLLLDTLGCGFAGLENDAARAVLATAASMGGNPRCSVIGVETMTSLTSAILVNGMLIRTLDLNDYVIESDGSIGGHPSDNIPVALAAGESEGRTGREVLAAIVLGYELYGRCKNMMERRSAWDGSSLSGIVAPVMAGWLMRLDACKLAHAIALSAARAATSRVVRSGDMSAAKSLANSLVAQNGAQAALLARYGATGPLAAVENPRGIKEIFPHFDAALLTLPLPADSYVMRSNIKAYPCVATAQSAVAAALELHRLCGGNARGLRRIRVTMSDGPAVRAHVQDRERADPKSHEAADHSFQFLVAAALLDGQLGLAQFENERWSDPAIRALMGRIEITADPALTRQAPGSYPCVIEAEEGERTHRAAVLYPPGFSHHGLKPEAVITKFKMLTAERLSSAERERVIDAVLTIDRSASLAGLAEAMRARACAPLGSG